MLAKTCQFSIIVHHYMYSMYVSMYILYVKYSGNKLAMSLSMSMSMSIYGKRLVTKRAETLHSSLPYERRKGERSRWRRKEKGNRQKKGSRN